MRLRTRSIEYEAICLQQHVTLGRKPDAFSGSPGEFLLIGPDGRLSLATKAEVRNAERFEVADAPTTPKKGKRRGRPPAAKARSVSKPSGKPPALKADQMALAKRLIQEGKPIATVAREIGIPYGTVYAWAKMNNWTPLERD